MMMHDARCLSHTPESPERFASVRCLNHMLRAATLMVCVQEAIDRGWLRTERSALQGGPCLPAVVATATEVAYALAYLHSHNVVHGDLSSWNVMLCSGGARVRRRRRRAACCDLPACCRRRPHGAAARGMQCSMRRTVAWRGRNGMDRTCGCVGATGSGQSHMQQASGWCFGESSVQHAHAASGSMHSSRLHTECACIPCRAVQADMGDRKFVAKVADFGLAKTLEIRSKIQTRTYGTLTHMPPETLMQGTVSKAVDVYSFGVLLWQMYTSSRPWSGLTHSQILMLVAQQVR